MGNFLFVNKTASSEHLTQSLGAQRTAIQSHVQHGVSRKGKPRSKQARRVLDDRALYNANIRSMTSKLDAFDTVPVRLDKITQHLLHYYVYNYVWTVTTNQPLLNAHHPAGYKSLLIPTVRTAFEDATTMNCLLALAVCRFRHHSKMVYPEFREHYLMSEALRHLQLRLNEQTADGSNTTDRFVRCMLLLAAAESFRNNHPASRTHLIAAKLALGSEGIHQLGDRGLCEHMYLVDLVISTIYFEPCQFSWTDDPGPSSALCLKDTEVNDNVEFASLGSALLSNNIVPSALKELILEILDTYTTKCGIVEREISACRRFEITHWISTRNRAIWKRILGFETNDQRIQALKAALIMWILQVMTIAGRVRTVKVVASTLRSLLDPITSQEWSRHEDLRLWMLSVGYHCARDDSEDLSWFAEQIRNSPGLKGRMLGTQSTAQVDLAESIVAFQRRFLYDEDAQKARTEALLGWLNWWDKVVLI